MLPGLHIRQNLLANRFGRPGQESAQYALDRPAVVLEKAQLNAVPLELRCVVEVQRSGTGQVYVLGGPQALRDADNQVLPPESIQSLDLTRPHHVERQLQDAAALPQQAFKIVDGGDRELGKEADEGVARGRVVPEDRKAPELSIQPLPGFVRELEIRDSHLPRPFT